MGAYSSTSGWKLIDLPILRNIALSTDMQELSRDNWSRWAASSTQFNHILAYSRSAQCDFGSTSPSTGICAALLTERIDLKDNPRIYNYNIYLIAETTDGKLFQSGPLMPSQLSHHSSSPSTWFEGLSSPL